MLLATARLTALCLIGVLAAGVAGQMVGPGPYPGPVGSEGTCRLCKALIRELVVLPLQDVRRLEWHLVSRLAEARPAQLGQTWLACPQGPSALQLCARTARTALGLRWCASPELALLHRWAARACQWAIGRPACSSPRSSARTPWTGCSTWTPRPPAGSSACAPTRCALLAGRPRHLRRPRARRSALLNHEPPSASLAGRRAQASEDEDAAPRQQQDEDRLGAPGCVREPASGCDGALGGLWADGCSMSP